jgi:hypothetical protein
MTSNLLDRYIEFVKSAFQSDYRAGYNGEKFTGKKFHTGTVQVGDLRVAYEQETDHYTAYLLGCELPQLAQNVGGTRTAIQRQRQQRQEAGAMSYYYDGYKESQYWEKVGAMHKGARR